MATTVVEPAPIGAQTSAPAQGPDVTEAFVADRQAFWKSFTSFVTMGAAGIVVLLILLAFFLT